MHNQRGSRYDCLMADILSSLEQSVGHGYRGRGAARQPDHRPRIGFGKTPDQNIEVLRNLERLKSPDLPLLVGVSRKSHPGLAARPAAGPADGRHRRRRGAGHRRGRGYREGT